MDATRLERSAGWTEGLRARGPARVDTRALRRFHIYADVFLVGFGWVGAWGVRHLLSGSLGPINGVETYLQGLPLIVPPWIASCWLFGIYQSARITTWVDQIQGILRGVLLGVLVVSTIGFFSKELDFGRSVVLFSAAFNLVLQAGSRAAFGALERQLRASGRCDVCTLVVGAGTTGVRLLQRIQDHPETGYRVVGFLDDDRALAGRTIANRPVLGNLGELRRIVCEERVAEVVIAIPDLDHSRMLSLVLECEDLDVTFRMVTALFDVLTTSSPVELIDDLPLVRLGGRRVSALYEAGKRAFDAVVAAALLVLSAPLLAWLVLRIRLDTPGPAFLVQTRIGKDGRPFRLYKLRTMRAESELYREAPRGTNDSRITRYGARLRRSSLDELPQFLNVLRGDMSLVGPRPEMPFIVETYEEWQRRRLTVKPGITGLWQILGRKDLPMHENLQYDFYYIHHRSFLFDLSILIRTATAVLSRRGAF